MFDALPTEIKKIIQEQWKKLEPEVVIEDIKHMAACPNCHELIRKGKLSVQIVRHS